MGFQWWARSSWGLDPEGSTLLGAGQSCPFGTMTCTFSNVSEITTPPPHPPFALRLWQISPRSMVSQQSSRGHPLVWQRGRSLILAAQSRERSWTNSMAACIVCMRLSALQVLCLLGQLASSPPEGGLDLELRFFPATESCLIVPTDSCHRKFLADGEGKGEEPSALGILGRPPVTTGPGRLPTPCWRTQCRCPVHEVSGWTDQPTWLWSKKTPPWKIWCAGPTVTDPPD